MKEACGESAHMKVILATGELGSLVNVYKASMVSMMAGKYYEPFQNVYLYFFRSSLKSSARDSFHSRSRFHQNFNRQRGCQRDLSSGTGDGESY